jgi:queuine/archaeosine tRNA-ribosyltransferase
MAAMRAAIAEGAFESFRTRFLARYAVSAPAEDATRG